MIHSPLLRLGLFVCIGLAASTLSAADKRSPWTNSRVRGTPEPPLPYRAKRIYPHLNFYQPTVLTNAPGTDRLFVAEQSGKVFSFPDDADCRKADLFLDAKQLVEQMNGKLDEADHVRFQAVYGLTFHPDFARNRKAYVCYVVTYAKGGRGQHPTGTRVIEITVDDQPAPAARVETEREVITWLQGGHNGGCIKFGLDGMLYVSTGDGGFAFPPDGRNSGQDVTTLLSAVLRIDVDHPEDGQSYAIPRDNPFVTSKVDLPEGTRKEIWAYGMRNPWKFSFDRVTGDLWVGDVGWELWELIYRVSPGDNYGWSLVEGSNQPVRPEQRPGPTPLTPPAAEIPHTEAASITGGFVYRGKKLPELVGQYIFGDWETRRFWSIPVKGKQPGARRELLEPSVRIVGFAERNDGELLLLDYDGGTIHELEKNVVESTESEFPRRLSETGLFKSVKAHTPASGVLPFEINASQWADHAQAERWIGLPGDSSIGVHSKAERVQGSMFNRVMDYPRNAVLMKTLSLEIQQGDPTSQRRIETQLLHFNGYDWRGYTYRWNDEQTDAELVDAKGATTTIDVVDKQASGGIRKQTWRFPSRMECIRCHNPWAEFSLAFNTAQLNRPRTDEDRNQLEWLYEHGALHDVLPGIDPEDKFAVVEPPVPPTERPRLFDPGDESASLTERARSYLHVNCAHCHRFNGGGSARIYLPFDQSIYKTEAIDTRPSQGGFGIDDARIIAPGAPYRSVLYFRIAKTGAGHMPHLGAKLIDESGLQLVHDWIQQMPRDMSLAEKVDKLIGLDELTVLAAENENAAYRRWQIARRIARGAERERPTQADMDAALKQDKEEASDRVMARAESRTQLIDELLNDPRGAIALSRAIRQQRVPDSSRSLLIATATRHDSIAVRDLFESFIPDDQRVKRLGDSIDAKELLAVKGDAARGRELFFEGRGISCRSCHQVDKLGKAFGPDLSAIGKKLKTRDKILESLLNPSKDIEPKYAAWSVVTESGKVHTGLLIKRTDEEVVLRDPREKDTRIPADEIEEMFRQRISLMPDRILRDLTAQQAADLLEWLSTLKTTN